VLADETLLRQCVLNLVFNAREALQHAPADRRRIELRTLRTGDEVHLIVRDHGPGLPAKNLHELFKPFVTTKGGSHAGLGLATVRSAMKRFGGDVIAENAADGGASFDLRFTAAAWSAIDAPASVGRSPRRRLLVVDDEAEVVDLLQTLLARRGHSVVGTHDPWEALRLAKAEPFDAVICDVGMPGLSGLDLGRRLRRLGARCKLVLITGRDTESVRADPRTHTGDRILQKPFLESDVERLLETLFS
jgi:CheY-like chemotaxis protein